MPLVKDKNFVDEPVELDDSRFYNCTFTRCVLLYSGGGHPGFEKCKFVKVQIDFVGAAGRTLALLQGFYHSPFRESVEITLESIKEGKEVSTADFRGESDEKRQ